MRNDRWRLGLAALFTISGTAHFVAPKPFAGIVPPFLGASLPWVYASGVAELACAAGLFSRPARIRSRAAQASAALLVAVFPANLYMAVEAFRAADSAAYRIGTLVRLPLQVPLVLAAVAVSRAESRRRAAAMTPSARQLDDEMGAKRSSLRMFCPAYN